MAKQTKCKKSLCQSSNCRGYTNKPLLGYALQECQLKITKAFAPSDEDKVPFDGTIEQELELYKILFPEKFHNFVKVKPQYRNLWGQTICPYMYKDLTKTLYEGEMEPKDRYIAIGDLVYTFLHSKYLGNEANLLDCYLFTKPISEELTIIYQDKREQDIEDVEEKDKDEFSFSSTTLG